MPIINRSPFPPSSIFWKDFNPNRHAIILTSTLFLSQSFSLSYQGNMANKDVVTPNQIFHHLGANRSPHARSSPSSPFFLEAVKPRHTNNIFACNSVFVHHGSPRPGKHDVCIDRQTPPRCSGKAPPHSPWYLSLHISRYPRFLMMCDENA